jgi:hypothetical protein
MAEVAWQPGLTEQPGNGVWVVALQGDGCLVEEGMTGYITGCWNKTPIIRWSNDHQSAFPLAHLARISRPRITASFGMVPCTSWKPAPVDGTDEGVCWPWIYRRSA